MEKKKRLVMTNVHPYTLAKESLSQRDKIGQLFMPGAFINDSETEILQLEKLIKEQHIGGLCFFHSRASAATNFEGLKKIIYNEDSFSTLKKLIQRYQNAAKYPLLISIDAEWGLAMRIENTPQYPYAITLGALQDDDQLIFKVGQQIAHDCKAAGIHWNLAPVVDINHNPNNPVIGYRSFGGHKNKVTEKALAFIKGTESEGILTCLKHFPGHGDTEVDSHLGLPLISKSKETLIANELYPFQQLIDEGVDSIMAGHLAVPALADGDTIPSSLSKKMLKEVLRAEMKFKGVVISDALNMHAVSKEYPVKGELEWLAFDAGNDVLCFAEHIQEGIATILKNATKAQIEESFQRVWQLKEKAFKILEYPTEELSKPDAVNKSIAQKSLTFFCGNEKAISQFSKGSFMGLELTKAEPHLFFKQLKEVLDFQSISSYDQSVWDLRNQLQKVENIVIAVYPPKVKPANFFDIPKAEIDFINELLLSKNVILYLFGNPYVLNHIKTDKAKAVLIAYQDFPVFEENAAHHFLGKSIAMGKIPVTINSITA